MKVSNLATIACITITMRVLRAETSRKLSGVPVRMGIGIATYALAKRKKAADLDSGTHFVLGRTLGPPLHQRKTWTNVYFALTKRTLKSIYFPIGR